MVAGEAPQLDLKTEKKTHATCIEGIRRGIILSAHDCSEGGAAVAILECCCGGGIGAGLEVEETMPPLYWLFSESQSRFIITILESDLKSLQDLAAVRKVPVAVLGRTGGDRLKINDWLDLEIEEMKRANDEALARILSADEGS
jgi:phosphoribosylformylglycinamidine (FGAM) synthase-like enzyme